MIDIKTILTSYKNKYTVVSFDKVVCVVYMSHYHTKAPVTPNGVATAFVQRSKTMSARCGIAAEYT